jgi:hypothetical protein
VFTSSAKIAAAIAIIVSSVIVSVNMVTASPTAPATSYGYDISFPQCGGNLPTGVGFGVVGVNYGHPFSTNPCLTTELQWSQSSLSGQINFYTNTDNPGPANNAHWPSNQQSPKVCYGANTSVCAYDYGWNAAQQSFASAITAESALGSSSPTSVVTSAHWWLDVETGNAWQSIESTYGPTATSFANDQAEVQGELAYFASVGVTWVGIYATGQQWRTIMGPNTGTGFATIPAWMPGYATIAAAQAACVGPSFLGGRVAMIQYPLNGLDGDYVCGLLSTPASASVSVAASASFTSQLSVFADPAPVTYVESTGSPSLLVSATGLVTASGALSAGTYVASGTTSDTAGNTGTFTFTLVVGVITQSAPTTGSVSIGTSSTYAGQLVVTGSDGTTTFTKTGGSPLLLVSATGLVTTIGTLPAGQYNLTGTTLDTSGDNGTFSFVLSVGTITQSGTTFATPSADVTSTFSHQLVVSGANGPVTFVQTVGSPALLVSPTGLITTSGPLAAGSYVVRGTTSDASGDRGKFFFNVRVSASITTTTTTTLPVSGPTTTTTTVPSIALPVAYRVVGHAVAGATVPLTITGLGFFGRPRVTSHAGTTAVVTKDTGKLLTLKVTVKPRSRSGIFTFTIALSNGTFCKVRYVQRPGTVAR